MNELKYIIFQPKGMGPRAILFNGLLVHSLVAIAIKQQRFEIVSAGFCRIGQKGETPMVCFGESESLKIASKPGDSEIVSMTLAGMHYF